MTKITNEIADNLQFQANHLYEQAAEFPEYKARNEAAATELEELETHFRNDDVDPDDLQAFGAAVGEPDGASSATQAYKRVLEDVGFGAHFQTAEDFLQAVIREVEAPSAA